MTVQCKDAGHSWSPTTAPGWYICRRSLYVDQIKDKRAAWGYRMKQAYCNAVAHCPGCLNHCVDGVIVQFCTRHYLCRLEDFAVVFPDQQAQRFTAPSADQQPLF